MKAENPRYDRPDAALEARADELLAAMTLAEKVGQLVQVGLFPGQDIDETVRSGAVGALLSVFDGKAINRWQHIAVEESRLGIPLLVGNDIIHGYRTIFPIPLAEACTWDPALLGKSARVGAEEAATFGTSWIFAPMVDICRDPRWGRIAEGAGEDTFLGRQIAQARVRGIQSTDLEAGTRIVACPKHYVGYGAAEAGRDYNSVDMSERTMREIFLPPFKAAFDAGAGTVMSAFNDVAGVPASGNSFTLRTILRDEWGFEGLAVSDYNSVGELIPHGVAGDLKEAARVGFMAGVDMDMMAGAYGPYLAELVNEGQVPQALVDESVRRLLVLKLRLGLFDHPYADETLGENIVLRDDFRALALEVAQKSMVLLKNDGGLLPLDPAGKRFAVIGPLAADKEAPIGCWAWNGHPEDVESVLDGLHNYLQDDAITHVPGCPILEDGPTDIDAAVNAAQDADVIIAAVGESSDMSGEAHSRAYLNLPGRQQELIDALAATGKPLVVVLLTGRPLAIPTLAGQATALLLAWHSGIRTGRAVADLLFGAANPSGRLCVSFPWAEGQIPVYYGQKRTGRPIGGQGTKQFDEPFRSRYIDLPNDPLFAFGYGLTYTTFVYSDLTIETPQVAHDGTLVVSATVRNTGQRPGDEVAQLYVEDLVATVTRPAKELKGFQHVVLASGEATKVSFEVPASELAFVGLDMRYVVEPGAFKLWVGPDATQGLEGDFEVMPVPVAED